MLPMEKSRYRGRAKVWQLGAAGTGTPQVGVELEVEEGDYKGERISTYLALSDAAADYTLQKLRNLGWTGTDIFDLEDPEKSASMAANLVEFTVELEDEVKDGQPVIVEETGEVKRRLKVGFINRGGGLAMKSSLTEDAKRALGAKMKIRLAALDTKTSKQGGNGGGPKAPAGGPPGPTPPPHGIEDEIPF